MCINPYAVQVKACEPLWNFNLQGNVLEVSAGTGRNMSYYNPDSVTAVTMTDASKHMLWHAKQKHNQQNAKLPVKFCLVDAQAMLSNSDSANSASSANASDTHQTPSAQTGQRPPEYSLQPQGFSPQQFDTVVDTFGLCSHRDPVAALQVSPASCLAFRLYICITISPTLFLG